MATFLLIHGSWHGGWCWDKIAPLLRAAGHTVLTPDLPGHGDDWPTTLLRQHEHYVPFICNLLDAQHKPVILVGHSSGGMLISAAAEKRPEMIAALVYLAAFLLPAGIAPPAVMRDDHESILAASLDFDTARGISTVRPACARAVFYADCAEAEAIWATSRLVPEPIIPPDTGMPATAQESASAVLPRVYIETHDDKALGLTTQRKMHAAMPCERIFSLATSHSPFLSAPMKLTANLSEVAAVYGQPKG